MRGDLHAWRSLSIPGDFSPFQEVSILGGLLPSVEISLHLWRSLSIPGALSPFWEVFLHPRSSLSIPGSLSPSLEISLHPWRFLSTPGGPSPSLEVSPHSWMSPSHPAAGRSYSPAPLLRRRSCKPLRHFCSKNFLALRKTLLTVLFLVWGTIFPKRG